MPENQLGIAERTDHYKQHLYFLTFDIFNVLNITETCCIPLKYMGKTVQCIL